MIYTFRVLALGMISLAFGWAQADGNKAQLAGTVVDPNQAAVAGAKVSIKNTGTGLLRELKTNDTGVYRAVLLDPGTYDLTVDAPGFAQ